jgi:hypothetical protein
MLKDLKKSLPKDKNKRLAVVIVALLALPITVVLVQRVVKYFTGAASATIYFEPSIADLPSDKTLRLMVDSGSTKVGFARVVVNFDNTKVRLTSEVSTTGMLTMNNADVGNTSSLPQDACTGTQKCIIKTPMNSANNTGTIVLVLAKDPRVSQNAPSGKFELANFTFTTHTSSQTSTNVTIDTTPSEQLQLVDLFAQKFNVSPQSATLRLNGIQVTNTPGASPTPGGDQAAYPNGVPHAIPGTIEAEDFDTGGEGVAYHDSDSGNNGNADYRSGESVDLHSTSDSGRGYHVGWTEAQEWLEYTVNVQSSGTYDFEARVANARSGAQFHMEMDGVNLTGTMNVPNTGSWSNWQYASKQISLTQGEHIMRVRFDTWASGGNDIGDFNHFKFTKTGGITATPTGIIVTPTPGGCSSVPGDVNGDQIVNVSDIIKILLVYQTSPPGNPCADLNGDDTVNVSDIIKVISYYP